MIDNKTGQKLEHHALLRHHQLGATWNTSYGDKLGRIYQGIVVDPKEPTIKRVEDNSTFKTIRYEEIPLNRCVGIYLSKVVCTFLPKKSDPNRTRITIAVQNTTSPSNVGTKMDSLDLVKLLPNSVISHKGAKFFTFYIKNFYIQTPLHRTEYVRIKLRDIPQNFIDEYKLMEYVHVNGWVYFEIRNGIHGLPQSGALANALLGQRLNKQGYYQCATTPGLYRQEWKPITFCLIVDNFGVEYVGERHALHLWAALE